MPADSADSAADDSAAEHSAANDTDDSATAWPAGETRQAHVIVVGGGIAGLVAARDLAIGGARVTLLEASDRLGGKLASHVVDGIELDAAAESFATRGGTVAALLAELGLERRIADPRPKGAWLLSRDGVARPLPSAGLLGIPSTPLARDVIQIVGFWGAIRAQADALLLGFVGTKERTLGALVRRRMGRSVLDRLVAPVAGAIYSAHPDDLELDVVAPRLRRAVLASGSLARAVLDLRAAAPAGLAAQGFEGGIFRIAQELAASLDSGRDGVVDVQLDASVVAVTAGGPGVNPAVALLDGTEIAADHVVVATELGQPAGTPIVLATLVVDTTAGTSPLDDFPRGTGVLVADGAPGVTAKALTHSSAKWPWLAEAVPDRHVIRLSYSVAPESDEQLRALAIADASALLGTPIAPESVRGFARQSWRGPRPGGNPYPPEIGVSRIGEQVSGAGLAAIILGTRTQAGNLLLELASTPGLVLTNL